MRTLWIETDFVIEECWHEGCGLVFGMSKRFQKASANNRTSFYCPRGHHLRYGKGELDRLRDELAASEARGSARLKRLRSERRSHSATKGHVTRQKKRAAAGVCPCCNRSFVALAKHMKTKHPDYAAEPK